MKRINRIFPFIAAGVCLVLAGCFSTPEPPVEQAAPDELPAPDAVPAGIIEAEVLDALPGTQTVQERRSNRQILATTRPARERPVRPGDLVALTGPEIGRLMIGNYYQHTGGRVLTLRPTGQAMVVRQGEAPDTSVWQITDDNRLCLLQGDIRTCQQIFRIGNDLLLAQDDGNQRRYRRLEERPDWL